LLDGAFPFELGVQRGWNEKSGEGEQVFHGRDV
jgi:hypothetical protein